MCDLFALSTFCARREEEDDTESSEAETSEEDDEQEEEDEKDAAEDEKKDKENIEDESWRNANMYLVSKRQGLSKDSFYQGRVVRRIIIIIISNRTV